MIDSVAQRRFASNAVRFVIALALANAPFWILGREFFGHRALINLDIALALLVLVARPALGIALLLAAWAADIVLNQSLVFHFATSLDLLRSLKFASALQLSEYLTSSQVLLALPFLAFGTVLLRVTRNRPDMLQPACLVIVMLLAADVINGSSLAASRDQWRISLNVAGSPVATMIALQKRAQNDAPLRSVALAQTVQGLVDIPEWAARHNDRSVLFVIVESLGYPRSSAVNTWLQAQLTGASLADRFEIQQVATPFYGSTTYGELRSLCALTGSYRELDETNTAGCLPRRLRDLGWTTIGMHGFSGRMFERRNWWSLIGLQTTYFADAPMFEGEPLCGSLFRGRCDDRLVQEAVKALEPQRRFVYLLTLNTHLPLTSMAVPPELARLCQSSGMDPKSCELTGQLGHVLKSVASVATESKRAPLVVVVGDHAPPFAAKASRDDFRTDTVPAFVLTPRDDRS